MARCLSRDSNLSLLQLLLCCLTLFITTASTQTCYFPDHTEAADHVPCSSNLYTPCCGPNSICLTNGLCMPTKQPFALSRASCTDKNWGGDCPRYCIGSQDQPSSGCAIVMYSSNATKSLYCCNSIVPNSSETTACPNDEPPFEIDDAKIILGRGALANLTKKATTSSPSEANDTFTTSAPTQAGNGTDAVVKDNTSKETAIGVGVGVPLGVIAIAAVAWAFWERAQRKKVASRAQAAATAAVVTTSFSPGDARESVQKGAELPDKPQLAQLPTGQEIAELGPGVPRN